MQNFNQQFLGGATRGPSQRVGHPRTFPRLSPCFRTPNIFYTLPPLFSSHDDETDSVPSVDIDRF